MKMLTLVIVLIFSFNLFAKAMDACPCQTEVQKLCTDAKDHSEHKACLEKHQTELSKECQDHIKTCDCQKNCPMKKGKKKHCKKQCPMKKKEEAPKQ